MPREGKLMGGRPADEVRTNDEARFVIGIVIGGHEKGS